MKRLLGALFVIAFLLTLGVFIALDRPAERGTEGATPAAAGLSAPVPTVPPDPVAIADALRAYDLLLTLQVDTPSPGLLISGGLEGVLTLVNGKPSLPPAFLPTHQGALQAALEKLMSENPRIPVQDFTFAFIEGMIASLDERHTTFLRPENWEDLRDNQRPYLGYSATNVAEGRLVWQVDAGSPADLAGIRAGDRLIAVNGKPLAQGSGNAVIGRTDTLTVLSPEGRQRTTQLTPGEVATPVEWRLLTGGVAYLRISSFVPPGSNEAFIGQLDAAMAALAASQPVGWIIDLRSNGGGVVTLANYTAGWFGYNGTFADVSVRPEARRVRPYIAERKGSFGGRPAVVLVNRRTASSSEMLAEALHASGIARIVGEQTAGSVRLAQYHEVAGGALQIAFADVDVGPARARLDKTGITPDETVNLVPADLARGIDAQLSRAIALIAGD